MPITILNIIGIILLGIATFFIIFIFLPWRFGAPFEPTSRKELENILKLARVKKDEKVAELGSGNGKIVIALAKQGAEIHGYEVNPFLVLWSRWKIKKLGLENKAFIHRKNFWKINFNNYDILVLFQINYVMKKLGDKIKKEAKKGTRVVSNTWKFPGKKHIKKISHVYLYEF